jgi:hypothetical protein
MSQPRFELTDARDALTQSRVLVHTFSADEIDKVINAGLEVSNKSYNAGEAACGIGVQTKDLQDRCFYSSSGADLLK